jgi:hypothetical protein
MAHMNHSRSNQIIWHDQCEECTERASNLPNSLGDLDTINGIKAWHYMRARRWSGGQWTADADQPSANDLKLYDCLYAIGVFLERAGISPFEVEERMRMEYDAGMSRLGMDRSLLGPGLQGINLTGIFVKGES